MIPINNENQENKKFSILPIAITVLAILIIAILVVVYYLVMTNSVPDSVRGYFLPKFVQSVKTVQTKTPETKTQPALATPVAPSALITKVVQYAFPLTLPTNVKTGYCDKASVAEPYRDDAFICTDLKNNYDPCFASSDKNKVVCQMDPLIQDVFVINLTKPLPAVTLPSQIKNNWAWFLELEDGTKLSPYSNKRPIIDGEAAFYGSSVINGQRFVIMDDLIRGETWFAKEKVLIQDANKKWITKSSGVVKVKTVWQ